MSTLAITLIESPTDLVSGIPEYIGFDTSSPATVFYTVDGTTPNSSSNMAVRNIYLSTHWADQWVLKKNDTLTIKAYAVSGDIESSVLTKKYTTGQLDINRTRLLNEEGVRVFSHGDTVVSNLSYDSSGDKSQVASVSFDSLDIKASETNSIGEATSGTSVSFINKATTKAGSDYSDISYVNNNYEFDPRAKVIVIDGTTQANSDSQVVRIINRPYNSMQPLDKDKDDWYNDHLKQNPTISGNLVRQVYDKSTGYVTFYYYESRDSRWIISKQKVSGDDFEITTKPGPTPFVFKWINDRVMTKIY